MAKGKANRNERKCQVYLDDKKRIKNKTRKLKKRIKNYKDKTKAEKVLKHIGRKKEGGNSFPLIHGGKKANGSQNIL